MKLLAKWLLSAAALLAVAHLYSGVVVQSFSAALVAALVIGLLSGFAGLWGVNGLKKLLGADDTLDVFGVHGV